MLLRSRIFFLLLTLVTLLKQMPAQLASLGNPEVQSEVSTSVQPNEVPSDQGGGAPPAGELASSDGIGIVIPGVVSLEDLDGAGILLGGSLSQGYGRITDHQSSNLQGSISVVQPYIALFRSGRRQKLLFEYSPTVDLFNQGQWDGSVLHRAGVRGYTLLSERWSWRFSAYATDGPEYVRELDGLAIGAYPGWMTFLQPTNTLRVASGTTGLTFRRTPRQEFSFSINDSYSSVLNGPHYDAGSARAQMTSYLTHSSNWHLYAQANRYSSQPGCTRVGGGAGFVWHGNSSTTLSVEGGPEYGSGNCYNQLTANFAGSLAEHFSPRTIFYLSAARDLVEPYLLQSRSTDVFSAKVWQKTSQSTNAAIGAGYARSSDIPGETIARYRGFLAFSEFHWRLSDDFSFVATYRYFKRDIGSLGTEDHHSWIFGSIVWHPVSRARRRS